MVNLQYRLETAVKSGIGVSLSWAECKELMDIQDENKRLREENQSFSNVLAMIHRDGGHYISKHGHKKASQDAIQILIVDRNRICPSCGKAVNYE